MSDPFAELVELHQRIETLTDPAERAIARGQVLKLIPAVQAQTREGRQSDVKEMRAAGMKDAQIGERLGITWARVSAIARGVSEGGNNIRRKNRTAESAEVDQG